MELVVPTAAQMAAAGCPPESTSHGANLCMLNATGDILNAVVLDALGPR